VPWSTRFTVEQRMDFGTGYPYTSGSIEQKPLILQVVKLGTLAACGQANASSFTKGALRVVVVKNNPNILRVVSKGPRTARFRSLGAADTLRVIVFAQQHRTSTALAANTIVKSRRHRAAPATGIRALSHPAVGAPCES